MVDILESFNMSADSTDIGLPPDIDGHPVGNKSSRSESEIYGTDAGSAKTTLSSDSGLFDRHLDRNSIWRNSSSSSSSNQSSLSIASDRDAVDGPNGAAYNRLSSLSTGSKTHFIMEEIIQTESSYIEDLKQICQGYLEPMRDCALFTSEDIINVFGNLEEIWNFHQQFFGILLPHDLCGPAYLASCFVQEGHHFQIYTTYCTNYPTSVNHLADLMKEFPTWFKERQLALHHVLQLGPYLLKPIQRILKYHLLLQKLVDNCDCDAEGYETVLKALQTMKNMAQKINEVQHQKERKIRFGELQLLLFELPTQLSLMDFGELLLEDVFRVSGAKGERHVFLFEKGLLIVKLREDQTFLFKNYIAHSNLMLSEVIPDNPLHFSVIPFDNPRLFTVLEARNMDQKRSWTSRLKGLMLKHFGVNIPDHVRQLVMQLGQVPQADGETSARRFRQIFHSPNAPEYLAKRRTKSPAREYIVKSDGRNTRDTRRKTAPILVLEPEVVYAPKSSPQIPAKNVQGPWGYPKSRPPKKEKSKATSVFHVSEAYIPRMKDDEFLFEETQIRKFTDGREPFHQSTPSLQEAETTYNPRKFDRRSSEEPPEPPDPSSPEASNIHTDSRSRLTKGLRNVIGKAYKKVIHPIMTSFNNDDESPHRTGFYSVDNSPSRHPLVLSAIEPTASTIPTSGIPIENSTSSDTTDSDGFYERDLDILEQISPEETYCFDADSAVYSDREEGLEVTRVPSLSPSAGTHPKLRRIVYGSAGSSLNSLEPSKQDGPLRKKASVIKKKPSVPRTKSAPGTPHMKERSALIKEKIRALEERAVWGRNVEIELTPEGDDVKERRHSACTLPTTAADVQLYPPGYAEMAMRNSWVNMMVKKIESGAPLPKPSV